jgi:hypothetical protein
VHAIESSASVKIARILVSNNIPYLSKKKKILLLDTHVEIVKCPKK